MSKAENKIFSNELFEFIGTQRESLGGWKTEDLSIVSSAAQNFKSGKTASLISSVAKLRLISKQIGLESRDFTQTLFELNPSCKLIRQNSLYRVVEISANLRLPKLPLGYAFKGGAARIALANIIGRDTRKLSARDFDVVRFSKGTVKQDVDVSSRLMPEDFSHGHGVEVVENLDAYFNTRDLTINEVLLVGRKVYFSARAFDDLRRGIIRPTEHLIQKGVPGRIACKILRLAAELQASGVGVTLPDIFSSLKITKRDYELHQARAAELGSNIEQNYRKLAKLHLGSKFDISAVIAPKPNPQASHALQLRTVLRSRQKHS